MEEEEMGLLPKKKQLIPGCVLDKESSRDGRVVWKCNSRLMIEGEPPITSPKPIEVTVERGQRATITDDGDAPDELLEEVIKWIEKHKLE